jgi:hypothetical protein
MNKFLLSLFLVAPLGFAETSWEAKVKEAAKAAAMPEFSLAELRSVARAFHSSVSADLLQRIVLALPDLPLREGRLILDPAVFCSFLTHLGFGKEPYMKELCIEGLLQGLEVEVGAAGEKKIKVQLKASVELRHKAYLYSYVLRGPLLSWTRAPRPQTALDMRGLFEKLKSERKLMLLRSNYTEVMAAQASFAAARRALEATESVDALVYEPLEGRVSMKMLGMEFFFRRALTLWTESGDAFLMGEVEHATQGTFMRAFGAAAGF